MSTKKRLRRGNNHAAEWTLIGSKPFELWISGKFSEEFHDVLKTGKKVFGMRKKGFQGRCEKRMVGKDGGFAEPMTRFNEILEALGQKQIYKAAC